MAMNNENVCRHFKFGFCRFSCLCKYKRVSEICLQTVQTDCEINTSEKRHPLECNYFRTYKRCKFGSFCLYRHEIFGNNDHLIEKLKMRLKAIEDKISKKTSEIQILDDKLNEIRQSKMNVVDKDATDASTSTYEMNEEQVSILSMKIVDMEAKMNMIISNVQALQSVSNLHKCKFEVHDEEFYAYSKVVDDLERKMSLVQNQIPGAGIRTHNFTASNLHHHHLATPPSSNKKKGPN